MQSNILIVVLIFILGHDNRREQVFFWAIWENGQLGTNLCTIYGQKLAWKEQWWRQSSTTWNQKRRFDGKRVSWGSQHGASGRQTVEEFISHIIEISCNDITTKVRATLRLFSRKMTEREREICDWLITMKDDGEDSLSHPQLGKLVGMPHEKYLSRDHKATIFNKIVTMHQRSLHWRMHGELKWFDNQVSWQWGWALNSVSIQERMLAIRQKMILLKMEHLEEATNQHQRLSNCRSKGQGEDLTHSQDSPVPVDQPTGLLGMHLITPVYPSLLSHNRCQDNKQIKVRHN